VPPAAGPVLPGGLIDATVVKIRDGRGHQPTHRRGDRCQRQRRTHILGLWAGDGSEGAKFWLGVLTKIKNRGVGDVCIVVCDGLKGLPDSITTAWPLATVQACIIQYPDVAVMPIPRRSPQVAAVRRLVMSA